MKTITKKIKSAVIGAMLCIACQTAFCQYGINQYSIETEIMDLPDIIVDTSIIRNVTDDVIIEYIRDIADGTGYIKRLEGDHWQYQNQPIKAFKIPFKINDMVVFGSSFGDSVYFCGTDHDNQPVFGWFDFRDIDNSSPSISIKYMITPKLQDVYSRDGGKDFISYTPSKLQLFKVGDVTHIVSIAHASFSRIKPIITGITSSTQTNVSLDGLRVIEAFGTVDLLLDIVLSKSKEPSPLPENAYSFPYKVFFSLDHMPGEELEDDAAFLTYDNLAVTNQYVCVMGHLKQAKFSEERKKRLNDQQEIITCVFKKPDARCSDTSIFNDQNINGRKTQRVYVLASYTQNRELFNSSNSSEFHSDYTKNKKKISDVYVVDGGKRNNKDCVIFAAEAFCLSRSPEPIQYDGIALGTMNIDSIGIPSISNEILFQWYFENQYKPNDFEPKMHIKSLVGSRTGWTSWGTYTNESDGTYAILFDTVDEENNLVSNVIESTNIDTDSRLYMYTTDRNVNFLNSISRHIDFNGEAVLSASGIEYENQIPSPSLFRRRGHIDEGDCYITKTDTVHTGHKRFTLFPINNHPWISSSRADIVKEFEPKYKFNAERVCASEKNLEQTNTSTKLVHNAIIVPNPAHAEITISSDKMISYIDVMPFDGQTIKTEQINGNSKKIAVSGLPKGIYMVRVHYQNSGFETLKLVIQ